MTIQSIEIVGRFTKLSNDELYTILENEAKALINSIRESISQTGIRVQSNRLADSIKYEKTGDLEIRIFADDTEVPYFKYLEYGTRPHDIFPRYRKSLKFDSGGKSIFAKRVHHPGTKAYAPFSFSIEKNRESIIKRVESLSDLAPEQEDIEE